MGVTEFTVCAERSLTQEELDAARREVEEGKPDGVIFHDRASVNRVRIAFPKLDLANVQIILASRGDNEVLEGKGIWVDQEDDCGWYGLEVLYIEIMSY